jgi:hypothetical protein
MHRLTDVRRGVMALERREFGLEDLSSVNLFFGTPAFYETSPGHLRAASDVGADPSVENHG